ncbi:MAG: hypothetical protein R3293_12340 [Candidatus Promineifilaceae bacterium]|nr:hypothetical protein [Candidatus Promineifilaceae bacterium]
MADYYEIHLKDHLDQSWEDWFEGFSFSHQPEGITVLCGPIEDQPSLHGLLARIGQLGLVILKVEQTKQESNENG